MSKIRAFNKDATFSHEVDYVVRESTKIESNAVSTRYPGINDSKIVNLNTIANSEMNQNAAYGLFD